MQDVKRNSNARIRVLILSKDFNAQGGIVNFVSSLMEHANAEIAFDHLSIGRNSGSKIRNLMFPLIDSVRLARQVLKNNYDCVHINPSLNAKAVLRDGLNLITLSIFGVKNIVVYFHGWDDTYANKIKNSTVLGFFFKRIFQRASMILVLATRFRDALLKLGFMPERVHATTTMFDGRIFDGVERQASEARSIIFLSRFVPEKGIYELLEAFSLFANKFPDVNLIMAGDGPERERMEHWVKGKGLVGRVKFPGYLRGKEKAQVFLNADLFVFPTYHGEGCPVSLLEAMAAGLPVVTTTAGGIPDVFIDKENGLLLRNVSPQEIEQAIVTLLTDDGLSKQMKETNLKWTWENYEAHVVAKKMEDIYTGIII